MLRFVTAVVKEVGRQLAATYRAFADPHNRATVVVTLAVLVLLVVAVYLLVTRYDALLRLVHHGLSCEALSNDKAAAIVVLGTTFFLSVPITVGAAVMRSEASRRGQYLSPVEFIVALLVSVSSGALLVALSLGFW